MDLSIRKPQTKGLDTDGEDDQLIVSRRKFLGYAIGAVGAFVGIVAGAPILGYVGSAFQSKQLARWVKLGPVEEFSDPAPKPVEFTLTRQDGWVEVQEARSCWVVHDGSKLAVLNGRCTHLGCAYSWQSEGEHADRFYCPCHGGVYDLGGHVIDGPPPRQLDRLETKEEDGELLVLYQDFRLGVPGKEPL